jgi:pectinesterase
MRPRPVIDPRNRRVCAMSRPPLRRPPLRRPILAAVLLLAAAAPLPGQRAAVPARVQVRAENPLPTARADETLSLPWTALRQAVPALRPDRVRVLDAATGAELASQTIDLDADGQPEELLVQASFWPGETKQLIVEAAAPAAPAPPRAYARHDAHRDDVAWETDRIAYRMYGQGLWRASEYQPLVSSGIDVWPKRVRALIVDRWYAKGHDAYHLDTGEGADFYTVGPTLGAGGSAVWREGRLHHAKNFRSHRILASGPIRTVLELHYDAWDAGGVEVAEVKRISMDAGSNLFRQEITYSSAAAAPITYAVGTVKREGLVGSSSRAQNWAWQSTWGPVERKNGGHGSLGTAVLMPRDHAPEARETDDHYLMLATARPGQTTTQYVGAGWTASGDFADVAAWWAYLDDFARRLDAPVRLTILR